MTPEPELSLGGKLMRLLALFSRQFRLFALGIGAVGVALGFVAYRSFNPRPSVPDAAYAAVQLLAFNTLAPTDGSPTPLLLHLARWLAATGVGLTIGLLLLQFGVLRAEQFRAAITTGHRVVIGSVPESVQLAICAPERGRARWLSSKSILIADLSETIDREACLRCGVIVTSRGEESLERALRGAREVVIAEHDDLRALDTATAVLESPAWIPKRGWRRVVRGSGRLPVAATIPPVRVVVRSIHLARSMREFAVEREGWESVTVVTLAEAVAEQLAELYPLIDPTTNRPRYAVVLGRRDEVAELLAALIRNSGSSRDIRQIVALVLSEGGDDEWNAQLSERLAGSEVELEVRTVSSAATAMEPFLDQLRQSPAGLAFVLGISGPDIVGLTSAVARRADGWRVVGVLDQNLPGAFQPSADGRLVNWSVLTVADLLAREDSRSWRTSARLALAIDRLRQIPSAEAALLGRLLPDGRSDRLADVVIDSLQESGYRVLQRRAAAPPSHIPQLDRYRIGECLRSRLVGGAIGENTLEQRLLIQQMLEDLPRWMAEAGWETHTERPAPPDQAMTGDQIDRLGQMIHAQYVELWKRLEAECDADGGSPPTQSGAASQDWTHLSEADRESNRAQARRYVTKLLALGYLIIPADQPGSSPLVLDEAVVERLGRFEHDGWMAYKQQTGWKPGDARDNDRKIHELIKDWDELTEPQREMDRNPVAKMATNLSSVGLAVVKIDQTEG